MIGEQQLAALIYVKNSGQFGTLQTVGVSVNYKIETVNKTDITKDLARIVALVGSGIKQASVVSSQTPFPHGFVDLFFENDVLVRYSFTATGATAYKDWRLYLTDAEVYLREGKTALEALVAKPESKPDEYLVETFANQTQETPILDMENPQLLRIVDELIG
jgi:hypothetical protein